MKITEGMDAPLYSEKSLRDNLGAIRAHLLDKDDLIRIPEILRKCGVRFALVEALPGSKIDGVCVWLDGQPAIGMTTRLDRLDNFAFVLRHEIEHVLRGDGKDASFSPVDEINPNYEDDAGLPNEEVIANAEAGEFCVPRQHLNSFIQRKSPFISEQDVLAFAARMEVHPAIVIGQIQNQTKKYAWLRKYQTGIRRYLLDWEFKDGWDFFAPTGL
jgi:HTH-type transcriptional regulator / antitoxin HigA